MKIMLKRAIIGQSVYFKAISENRQQKGNIGSSNTLLMGLVSSQRLEELSQRINYSRFSILNRYDLSPIKLFADESVLC